MLCDICKKNEATIHYQEIIGGKQKSLNVCAACAQEHEKAAGLNFGAFNLAEMLCNLGKLAKPEPEDAPDTEAPAAELRCPQCGRTVKKLRETGGRLGCAACYQAFASVLKDVIARVQRGKVHVGKRPGRRRAAGAADHAVRILRLKQELAELVKCENYEKAALVRDEIRALEQARPARKTASAQEEA